MTGANLYRNTIFCIMTGRAGRWARRRRAGAAGRAGRAGKRWGARAATRLCRLRHGRAKGHDTATVRTWASLGVLSWARVGVLCT